MNFGPWLKPLLGTSHWLFQILNKRLRDADTDLRVEDLSGNAQPLTAQELRATTGGLVHNPDATGYGNDQKLTQRRSSVQSQPITHTYPPTAGPDYNTWIDQGGTLQLGSSALSQGASSFFDAECRTYISGGIITGAGYSKNTASVARLSSTSFLFTFGCNFATADSFIAVPSGGACTNGLAPQFTIGATTVNSVVIGVQNGVDPASIHLFVSGDRAAPSGAMVVEHLVHVGYYGTGSPSLPHLVAAGTGRISLHGSGSPTLVHLTVSGAGTVIQNTGTGSPSLVHLSPAGTGNVISWLGSGAPSLAHLTTAGTGSISLHGSGSPSLVHLTAAGSGNVLGWVGSGSPSLVHLSPNGTGWIRLTGTGSPTLVALSPAGTGVSAGWIGSGAPTLVTMVPAGTGNVIGWKGTGSPSLVHLAPAGTGSISLRGTGSPSLAHLTVSATGSNRANVGTGAPALAHLTVSGTGTFTSGVTPVAFVQVRAGGNNSSSVALAYNSNTTAGNFLMCIASVYDPSNNSNLTCADASVAWLNPSFSTTPYARSSDTRTYVFYRKNCAGGAVTVTVSGGTGGYVSVVILECSSVSPVLPFTGSPIFANGNSTSPSPGAVTVSDSGSAVVAGYGQSDVVGSASSVSTGFTIEAQQACVGGSRIGCALADRYNISTNQTATFTCGSTQWAAAGVCLTPTTATGTKFVQNMLAHVSSGTCTATLNSNSTSGGFMIVAVTVYDPSNNAVISVSDSTSTSWTLIGSQTHNSDLTMAFFYRKNTPGTITTVSATMTGGSGYKTIEVLEYAGLNTTSPISGSLVSATGTSSTPSPGSVTVANAHSIVLIACGTSAIPTSQTVGGSFVMRENYLGAVGSAIPIAVADIVDTASNQTGTVTYNSSQTWTAIGVCLTP